MAQPQPQYQQNSPSDQNQQQYNNSTLKGSEVRVITDVPSLCWGFRNTLCHCALSGTTGYQLQLLYCRVYWLGIWGGVVIVYMILAIIASVIAVGGLISSAVAAVCVRSSKIYDFNYRDVYVRLHQSNTHVALYILLAVTFAIQSLAAIIGASFTCVAVCPESNNRHQQVIYMIATLIHRM
ncbi:hypothetical protein BSL78_09581 [Apostichopus japonicus]|uniref:Uncharacterized protein n=1 Tax=Stichopus japonicus TaxID=307972 RepID=A0A2G8L075_STIJA|nr:hypothetical protein BSL78_09581 [Apostichopus japonicus]